MSKLGGFYFVVFYYIGASFIFFMKILTKFMLNVYQLIG